MLQSINPVNDSLIKKYDEHSDAEIEYILKISDNSYKEYKSVPFSVRTEKMKAAAEVLRSKKDAYALIMTQEMGKPITQAESEVEKCAWVCEYYSDNAEKQLQSVNIETDASESFVTFQPLGVVLAVMPWNFPFWQVFRFAAPALMAGNAGVLKHSSNVTGCALAIEEVFREAGFADGLFKTLKIPSKRVEQVITNPIVKAVTLTGSTPAGKAVAKVSGSVLKKTLLELGGSDPYVILEDADIELAAKTCVTSRLINGGQSCIAAKRFIIVESVYDQFKDAFVEEMKSKKMGDPLDRNVDVGPQARTDLRDELHIQVKKSVEMGAKVLLGGEIPEGKGAYYPPTILEDVKKGMPAFDEELFGPVAPLIKAKDESEAIAIANDTPFGLGAAVFTDDKAKGKKIASDQLEAGCCFVNEFVKSDPRLPFGGIKESGYGRELSMWGIQEFMNTKTVYVK